jgi:hypothetical protein
MMYLPVEQLLSCAEFLAAEFEQGGGTSYIEEAIDLDREALELCPPGHPKRSVSLTQLSIHLSARYSQLGATRDLDEAIVLDREELDIWPQRDPQRSISLHNLAVGLSTRYEQLGAMQDLNEAILLNRAALDLRPQGTLIGQTHWETLQLISPLGTSISGRWRISLRAFPSTENHSTFARKGTLIGQRL